MSADSVVGQKAGDGFRFAAMRFCEEHEIPAERLPVIEYAMRHRAFMEAIQPYIRTAARVSMFAIPPMVIHSDGSVERLGDGLNDDQRATLAVLEKLINNVAEQHGLTPPPAVVRP